MINERIMFIVQARTGSSRLPKKMLLPIDNGRSVLEIIIDRLSGCFDKQNIVIATTDKESDDSIEEIATRCGVRVYRGSENDVLERFIGAAEHFGAKKVIRICADNIFLDISKLELLYKAAILNNGADYISFMTDNGTPSIKTHFGFWAEAVTTEALRKVRLLTDESLYHEHVTNYIYSHPETFRCFFIPIDAEVQNHPSLRLTLDTIEDYEMIKEIYDHFVKEGITPSPIDIIIYLDAHKDFYVKMQENISKNSK